MEFNWTLGLVALITLCFLILFHRKKAAARGKKQPPAPPGWPVFGNLFNLGTMPHRTVAGLAAAYGPIVRLKLGSVNTVAILNVKAATELFKNHDLTFVDRTITETSKSHDYDKSSLALAPYGMYWRVLRKICTVEMLVAKRINESTSVRRKCVDNMLSWVEKEASVVKVGSGIHIAKFVFLASFNMLGNLMLSRDLANPDSKLGSEFFTAMLGLMEWGGHPNISDLYPWLKRFDLLGLRKKMDTDMEKALEIATGWVEERVEERRREVAHLGERRKDFLDVLLDHHEGTGKDEPERMSHRDITIFILEIFLAGSETTSSTIEWALSELLRCPEKMARAKDEIVLVIGPDQKLEETQRVLHLVLGSLLHEFDWELESHVNAETLDMKDKLGIVVRKLEPLKVIPQKVN
ncbi:cytochrome P450 [Artemisia annua]|uniref:Cytochrome P450 n=1 Tax=Artemisia annua TaxID=35608 RepID=A0A2U1MVB2_ARTAN|nr:cytochrome P450 [Artemisia annua]